MIIFLQNSIWKDNIDLFGTYLKLKICISRRSFEQMTGTMSVCTVRASHFCINNFDVALRTARIYCAGFFQPFILSQELSSHLKSTSSIALLFYRLSLVSIFGYSIFEKPDFGVNKEHKDASVTQQRN